MSCELCTGTGESVLWQDSRCRVIRVDEPGYPGFCRVIWHRHVAEMTDLDDSDREHCMRVVLAVERVLRRLTAPDKINLASLGNKVAHVHWHVIPRFRDDPHFPEPVWGQRQRQEVADRPGSGTTELAAALAAELGAPAMRPV